jgi:hypothetical protein
VLGPRFGECSSLCSEASSIVFWPDKMLLSFMYPQSNDITYQRNRPHLNMNAESCLPTASNRSLHLTRDFSGSFGKPTSRSNSLTTAETTNKHHCLAGIVLKRLLCHGITNHTGTRDRPRSAAASDRRCSSTPPFLTIRLVSSIKRLQYLIRGPEEICPSSMPRLW